LLLPVDTSTTTVVRRNCALVQESRSCRVHRVVVVAAAEVPGSRPLLPLLLPDADRLCSTADLCTSGNAADFSNNIPVTLLNEVKSTFPTIPEPESTQRTPDTKAHATGGVATGAEAGVDKALEEAKIIWSCGTLIDHIK
jgi:hypothetical protein